MLEPHGRTLLFDILKPPEDHRLDAAVGTTFTLDLLALLTAPVAFSLFDVDDHRELLDQSSLTLLESLRRYADKITVFCQAGYIGLPKIQFPQLEFLEKSIVQCRPRVHGAYFHSKIWLLRFVAPEDRVTYRFACLTRNLTFDRCWDTALTLEGSLGGATKRVNRPLAEFIRALPRQSVIPVDDAVVERTERLADEVGRVNCQPPEPFESFEFHPLGSDGDRGFPFDNRPGRMLVISPFVSDGGLQRLLKGRENSLLVSRSESLEQPDCRFDGFKTLYVLRREADQEEEGSDQSPTELTRGLHAKCYVVDAGWKAHVFTGSANATDRGFGSNVEFMVELVGPKSKVGIDALFSREEGRTCLGDLVEEFKPEPKPLDEAEEGHRAAIERTRHTLAGLEITASVKGEGDEFSVELRARHPIASLDEGIHVHCWPVTVGRGKALQFEAGQDAVTFERLSFEALTSFIAFEVTIRGSERSEVFVLNVRLLGAPTDRRERLLRSFIRDRQRLMRFLFFLLADDSELADALGAKADRSDAGTAPAEAAQSNGALLETLLRTLHRSPERLDAVARLVEDVRTQPDASNLLPAGFDDIWAPVWAMRRGVAR